MEKSGADKSGLQPFIVSMRAEIEAALHAEDTLKAGFAQLFLSGALSTLDVKSFEVGLSREILIAPSLDGTIVILSSCLPPLAGLCWRAVFVPSNVLGAHVFKHAKACSKSREC